MYVFELLSFFLIILAFFHGLLFIERIRGSWLFWYCIDYLWLLGAFVGIIFASLEGARLSHRVDLDQERATLRGKLNVVRMNSGHVWEIYQGEKDRDGGQGSIQWFKKVADELELGLDNPRWSHFVTENLDSLINDKELPESHSRYVRNKKWESYDFDCSNASETLCREATNAVRDLNEIFDEQAALAKLEASTKSSNDETWWRGYWPLLLCFALALRITKVSSDILRHLESERKCTTKTDDDESDAP